MKRLLLLMMATATLAFVSCSKDDDDVAQVMPKEQQDQQTDNQVEETRYYVKYEVSYGTVFRNNKAKVTFMTETGLNTIQISGQKGSWEGTYGPLKKHQNISLKLAIDGTDNENSCHARIYVSRDKEPFVIKAEGSGVNTLELSYKIDF